MIEADPLVPVLAGLVVDIVVEDEPPHPAEPWRAWVHPAARGGSEP